MVEPAAERPVLWTQVALGLLLFGIYLLVDSLDDPARRAAAHRHGHDIFAFEQRLHIDVEHTLNDWLAPHHLLATLANYEYAYTYILSAVALLVWVWIKHPDLWRATRDSFVVLNLVAMATFALFPTAPPRMLSSLGFVDTVTRGGTIGSWGDGIVDAANQVAAMPSLHVGWALWVSVILARITAARWVQVTSGIHVALTLFVVMATANHYLLDAIAVVVPVALGVGYVVARYGGPPGEVVLASDAFFLHVEDGGWPHQVGGLVILEPHGDGSEPTIEQVREKVRGGLAQLPRYRQRLSPPSRWRRLHWVDDDDVDLDWHVTEWHTDSWHGLYRVVSDFAEHPMPRDRPLWRVVMVRGVAPGVSALVFLAHHSLADGISTVISSLELFDPPSSLPLPTGRGPGVLQRAAAVTTGLAQLATDGGAGPLGDSSTRRQYAALDVPLDDVRRLAADRHVRVTDLMMALTVHAIVTVAPELATQAPRGLKVSVPLLVQSPSSATGNVTAAVIVDVPVDGRPFDDLLAAVSQRSGRLRRPTRAFASRFVMATGLRVLPEPMAGWFARTVYGARFLHVVVSNMPGPVPALSFVGVPLHRTYPILPVAPGTALSLGALSWTGMLGIGLATDPALLDVDALATEMSTLLDALGAREVGGTGVRRDPAPRRGRVAER